MRQGPHSRGGCDIFQEEAFDLRQTAVNPTLERERERARAHQGRGEGAAEGEGWIFQCKGRLHGKMRPN